ncbi:MAG TPA: UDP-4-amino-4,6-dideoxy-N-acetyl-beta-L-altrosamine transaminase, partial [Pseudomonas sp.]|nr:UDP-4-amino-4,6-dideoxy-N-acetyl-beta-L-altrosamine transaminase [Pseudomonas sp.]
TQPYYAAMGFAADDFPQSMAYYREAISLPMYHSLTEAQQDEVVAALTEVCHG